MLSAEGVTKRYPGVVALDGVDFSIAPGEVVALLGENGAGKSTLIKILAGLVRPDSGTIRLNDRPLTLTSPDQASKVGIGIIHQELNNLDNLDVASNVFLGREPRKFRFLVDRAEAGRRTRVLLNRLGLDVSPETPLSTLSIARQQLVEIAKALSLDARYLIMDEPTSSLTAGETQRLLEVIRELAASGVGVVYVSHRLGEVEAIADRAVVLRDGKNAGALAKHELSTANMVRLMVGRDLSPSKRPVTQEHAVRLRVQGLRTRRFPQHEINFAVGAGEIVGMAGLVGAGRSEIARALFGADPKASGLVELDGSPIVGTSPRAAIRRGLYLAPEDRRATGLITSMSVRENITLPSLEQMATAGLVHRSAEREMASDMRAKLGVKAPSIETLVRGLSGGNQQKVVLAKWLARNPKCLIFDEPTRGIDIGARAEIYGLMRGLADDGVAILMISSDMEEILAMSDRVLVMHEGRLAGELSRADANEQAIMRMAVGDA